MKIKILLLLLIACQSFFQTHGVLSEEQAQKLFTYLDALSVNYKEAFRQPVIQECVEELIALYYTDGTLTFDQQAIMHEKLSHYTRLIESIDDESIATKYLNPNQVLITYWTQVVNAINTILDVNGNAANITSPTTGFAYTYTLQLPTTQGSAGQVLATNGNNPAQLSWITTVTNSSQLNLLYTATSADIPNTLVLRDNTGSFAATNVTVTGATVYLAPDESGTISFSAPDATTTYALTLPPTGPAGVNQALLSNGSGGLQWSTVQTSSSGIQSINGLMSANQYLTTSTGPQTLFEWIDTGSTHRLNIPYAANVTGNNVGLITGQDWQNFEYAYTTVLAATPQDVPSTLVLRDGSGSFVATNVTTTGYEIFQGPAGATVSLGAQTLSATYTLNWPVNAPAANQALFYNGNNQLSWVTTLTGGIESINGLTAPAQFLTTSTAAGTLVQWNDSAPGTHQLNIPYAGNLIGTSSVGLISGIDYQNFENTYTTVLAATPNDVPNTLVLRDNTGSFAAYNIRVDNNLTVDNQTGAVVAASGLYTATVGTDGTRLASFPLTDTPAVNFFQPVEPSRESYFFDDFISFNNGAGDLFYGDTQWIIGNNTPSGVSAQAPTASAIGITRLTSGASASNCNYLTKQLTTTASYSLSFGNGPCLNEWNVSLPALSSTINSFTTFVGVGDNPTGYPANGVYFAYSDTINSGSWTVNTANQGSSTTVTTAVAPTAGAFQRLSFQVNANATSVSFFINDVPVGTITTTIPTIASASYCSPYATIIRNAGNGGSLDLDYWYFHYTFNSRR